MLSTFGRLSGIDDADLTRRISRVAEPCESYIDGIRNRDDSEEWLTEIRVAVAAGGGHE